MTKKTTPMEKLAIPVAEGSDAPFLRNAGDDEKVHIRGLLLGETLWLPQRPMAELFQNIPDNIGLHLQNLYAEGETTESAGIRPNTSNATPSSRLPNLIGHKKLNRTCTEY